MGYREFRDGGGELWTVWDTYPESSSRVALAELASGWLTFESSGARRRLAPPPADWPSASESQLLEWLMAAVPGRFRRRLLEGSDTAPPDGIQGPAAFVAGAKPRI